MALKKANTAATVAPQPEPVPQQETAAATEAEILEAATAVATAAGVVVAPAALAPAVSRGPLGTAIMGIDPSLLVPGGKEEPLWEDLKGNYTADFGELPRLKAEQGQITDSNNKVYGKYIGIQVVGWNPLWIVSPGDQDAPGESVGYSHDGEYLDDGSGTTVKEHLEDLKKNYAGAAVKEYYEVVGICLTSEKPQPEMAGEYIQLQLSPTSVSAFNSYRKQGPGRIRMGKIPEGGKYLVKVEAEVVPKNKKGHSWTKFKFEAPMFG